MDAVAHNTLFAAGQLHTLVARATSHCYHDSHGRLMCKRESFFMRVGRWIMAGILIFFGLILLAIICCCIRRRRAKRVATV